MKSGLVFLLLLVGGAVSQIPIPARPLGYIYLDEPNPMVVIEVFYDHLCDDSAASWPTVKQVKEAYSGKGVKMIIHIFPLVNHHNAFFMQKAGEVVRNESLSEFVPFLDETFKTQDQFLTGAVDLTEPQVQEKIAELTEKTCSVSKEKVMKGFVNKVIDRRSRNAWRYGAHRGITGTPQFLVNGVHDPLAANLDFDGWQKLIDQLKSEQI